MASEYRPELSGENRHSARPTIGFVNTQFHEDWAFSTWLGVVEAARQRDVNLVCIPGGQLLPTGGVVKPQGQPYEPQANILYDLAETAGLDGMILWTAQLASHLDSEELSAFCRRYAAKPLVTLEKQVEDFPNVLLDSYTGMTDAIHHLIEAHGHRRIAFIRFNPDHVGFQERYRAYTDALERYGIPLDPNIVLTRVPNVHEEQVVATWLREVLAQGVDAVVSVSDLIGTLTVKILRQWGVRIPEDVAVVSCDDSIDARACLPPLTSVHLPFQEWGQQAVDMVLRVMAGEPTTDQAPILSHLIVRRSCGCLGSAAVQLTLHRRRAAEPADAPPAPAAIRLSSDQQAALERALTAAAAEMQADLPPQWEARLIHALLDDLQTQKPRQRFLFELDAIVRSTAGDARGSASWHRILSTLYAQAQPLLASSLLERANVLWQQARILIGEIIEWRELADMLDLRRRERRLRSIGAELITTFNISDVMTLLARELPRLGITSGYVALYDDPQHPADGMTLQLAYTEQGGREAGAGGRHFPETALVIPDVLPHDRPWCLIANSLYFHARLLGFAMLEIGPRDVLMYKALQVEISSALQGALLVQRVQQHAAEVARQNYILDTFMDTVPDSIYFKDRAGRITRANQAHARRRGYTHPDEEIGKTDFDFFSKDLARLRYEQDQQIMQTGRPLTALEEAEEAGQYWALTTKMPLRDEHGDIIGTFGISRDITDLKQKEQELIRYRNHLEELVEERTTELTASNTRLHAEVTERQRAEEALRVSERQYRLLAENVTDGVVIVAQGRIVFVNAAFPAIIDASAADLLTSEFASLFASHERQDVENRLDRPSAQPPGEPWHAEITTGAGQIAWIEIDHTTILWDNMPATLLTIHDITEQKRREEQLEAERTRLQQENLALKTTMTDRFRFGALVGKSPAMQNVYELILSAATSDVNALIVGESGTGKELIAQTIHQVSTRKDCAFVAVNCASIPESLFEREFFGHRRGTFTGADRDRPGLFDRAHRGVLFLDEVTELTPGTQAKLLRVLQDGEYLPLGSTTPKQADVLIVAATNKEYAPLIAQGGLRADFFYRINVVEIAVPPLRERKDDLPLLIEHILAQYRKKQTQLHGTAARDLPTDQSMLPDELIRAVYAYHWPGNVRELQNIVQRYLATQRFDVVLPLLGASASESSTGERLSLQPGDTLPDAVKAIEKRLIAEVLAEHDYHTGTAAKRLGIARRTLQQKMKLYGLPD